MARKRLWILMHLVGFMSTSWAMGEPVADDETRAEALDRLNRCDAATLDAVPGLGPVLVERVLSWRDRSGIGFASWDELVAVPGIGPGLGVRIAGAFGAAVIGRQASRGAVAPGEIRDGPDGMERGGEGRRAPAEKDGSAGWVGLPGTAPLERLRGDILRPAGDGQRLAIHVGPRGAARAAGALRRAAWHGSRAARSKESSPAARSLAPLLGSRPPAPRKIQEQDGRLDLNAASTEELERLPGVGASMARGILEERERNGDFDLVEDLLVVEGVSVSVLEGLRSRVRAGRSRH